MPARQLGSLSTRHTHAAESIGSLLQVYVSTLSGKGQRFTPSHTLHIAPKYTAILHEAYHTWQDQGPPAYTIITIVYCHYTSYPSRDREIWTVSNTRTNIVQNPQNTCDTFQGTEVSHAVCLVHVPLHTNTPAQSHGNIEAIEGT